MAEAIDYKSICRRLKPAQEEINGFYAGLKASTTRSYSRTIFSDVNDFIALRVSTINFDEASSPR